MTVREAFEKAYGPVPKEATCHIGYKFEGEDASFRAPTFWDEGPWSWDEGSWGTSRPLSSEIPDGPNIADRQAHWFLGFFGDEYDRVVSEDQAAWRAALHGARVSVSDTEDDGA